MNVFIKHAFLLLLGVACYSHNILNAASFNDYEVKTVNVIAANPAIPTLSIDERRRLMVGTIEVYVNEFERDILNAMGPWVECQLEPVYKRGGLNNDQFVDDDGFPTGDPSKYAIDYFYCKSIAISAKNHDGSYSEHLLDYYKARAIDQHPRFAANTAATLGEAYYYDGTNVHIIDVKHQTGFASASDVQSFHRRHLLQEQYLFYRKRGQKTATGIHVGSISFAEIPTRTIPIRNLTGGLFAVTTIDNEAFAFYEKDILLNDQPSGDLYFFEGQTVYAPSAFRDVNTSEIRWSFIKETDTHFVARAPINMARPVTIIPEPYYTQVMKVVNQKEHLVATINEPANRTSIHDTNTDQFISDTETGKQGTTSDKDNADTAKTSVLDHEYFGSDKNGNIIPIQRDRYAEVELESINLDSVDMDDSIALRMQQEHNTPDQVAPELEIPPDNGDALALQEAIRSVEEELHEQTASSLPLRGKAKPRFADMNPAGWYDYYLEGNPIPGDGDNPEAPKPTGITTGAPAYDLDGDGDLDRFYTDDPYEGGYDQVLLKWKTTSSKFRMGSRGGKLYDNNFAVYVMHKGKPEGKKMMFCGADYPLYVQSKKITGQNYYSFALESILDPLPQPNQYRFGLKYIGKTQPIPPTTDAIVPSTATVTWESYTEVDLGPTTVSVLSETGRETIYLYEDLLTPEDLIGAAFSESDFTPRVIQGFPSNAARIERKVQKYNVVGSISEPGEEVVTTVFYPAAFDDSKLEHEPPVAELIHDNEFKWDYRTAAKSMPWNYHDGKKFPRISNQVTINNSQVIAKYNGDIPMQSVQDLIDTGGASFIVKETSTEPNPDLLPVNPDDLDDPNHAINAQRTADWKYGRAMYHDPYDSRTDKKAGSAGPNSSGERLFDIIEGAGFYIFKGQKINYSSTEQQRELLRRMWEWDMYEPKTVYKILHVDNDPSKPLLNTAVAATSLDAKELYGPKDGILHNELKDGGNNNQTNVLRRNELKETQWFIFSAAEGREMEVQWALTAPKTTKLVCVEWDDYNEVQKRFAHRDVTFVTNDEMERKIIGELITKVYGKVNAQARINNDGLAYAKELEPAIADLVKNTPGQYVFLEKDILYGKPANFLTDVALLDDLQYGNPRQEQWYTNHKMQFRHPMAVFYDDRHSAVVAAYGENANPLEWTERWDDYSIPVQGEGQDPCKIAFEAWSNSSRLMTLYDQMNADEYETAKLGNIVLPLRPTAVAKPIKPTAPNEWVGGSLEEPAVLDQPGQAPPPPIKPIAPWAGYNWGFDDNVAETTWLALKQRIDYSRKDYTAVYHGRELYRVWTTGQVAASWTQYLPLKSHPYLNAPDSNKRGPEPMWNASSLKHGSHWNVHTGKMHNGTDTHEYCNYVDAVIINNNAHNVSASLSYSNDDGGAIFFRDAAVKVNEIFSTSRENGSVGITIQPGVNTIGGYHMEWHGRSYYDFRLSNQRWETFANSNNMELYPVYRENIGNSLANSAVTRYKNELAAYDQAVKDHEIAMQAYNDAVDRYNESVNEHNEWKDRVSQYEIWVEDYNKKVAEYQKKLAEYEVKLLAYNEYLEADQVWQDTNAELIKLKEAWDTYEQVRDNWVFLVSSRIAESGAEWEGDEPTQHGFDFWKTTPEGIAACGG